MGTGHMHYSTTTRGKATAGSSEDQSPTQRFPLQLLVDQQRINQDKVDVWVCREEEQLGCVTTLVQDPLAEGHCLRLWTKVYDMLGVPEALQRELVLLAVMLEQPSFVP